MKIFSYAVQNKPRSHEPAYIIDQKHNNRICRSRSSNALESIVDEGESSVSKTTDSVKPALTVAFIIQGAAFSVGHSELEILAFITMRTLYYQDNIVPLYRHIDLQIQQRGRLQTSDLSYEICPQVQRDVRGRFRVEQLRFFLPRSLTARF